MVETTTLLGIVAGTATAFAAGFWYGIRITAKQLVASAAAQTAEHINGQFYHIVPSEHYTELIIAENRCKRRDAAQRTITHPFV